MRKIKFKGQKVLVFEKRIHKDEVNENLNLYELRHSDEDWSEIATIENNVVVNHYGSLVSLNEIKFNGNDCYVLNDKEIKRLSYGGDFVNLRIPLKDYNSIKNIIGG